MWWCAALLALSVVVRVAWGFITPNGMNLVDLHVYVDGSAALLQGDLYGFTYSEDTPDFPLPFTYPPFAALVFLPLHLIPFGILGVAWQLLTVAALFAVVWISLELVVGARARSRSWIGVAMLWTAAGIWTEPVRTTLDYGQINVFLVLGVMLAARSSRWWLSGGLVGVLAGIKLTPAITGLYFLAQRRWREAVFSAVVFVGTVLVSLLVLGSQAATYFGSLFGDADRIGPVVSVWNQSLRGALGRLAGEDVGLGPVWLVGVVVCAVLAFAAWRSLGPLPDGTQPDGTQPDGTQPDATQDRLGTLLIVQLFGLLVSPISWVHHWVWVVPLLLWLVYGPLARSLGARIVAACWAVVTLIGVPWVLSTAQNSIWDVERPAPLAWLGAVNVVGVLAVYVVVILAARRRGTHGEPVTTDPSAVPPRRSDAQEPDPTP
ncbi:mannosyltransferase [Rhodococcus pyridinivorans]|uniref:mannosyltransferase n=1 Tax=Rhodococcus pyridinivorans TaxID=103816 RepID=UPI002658269C|nr:mannosyltransferase [Rhodococcus pyridinivorans]